MRRRSPTVSVTSCVKWRLSSNTETVLSAPALCLGRASESRKQVGRGATLQCMAAASHQVCHILLPSAQRLPQQRFQGQGKTGGATVFAKLRPWSPPYTQQHSHNGLSYTFSPSAQGVTGQDIWVACLQPLRACLHEVAMLHDARHAEGGRHLAHCAHHDVVDHLQSSQLLAQILGGCACTVVRLRHSVMTLSI